MPAPELVDINGGVSYNIIKRSAMRILIRIFLIGILLVALVIGVGLSVLDINSDKE